jgi:HD superfamily phosphohydrolase
MDYLMRDSLHAGVPYGRNFDQSRLVQSLCLNEAGDGLAITDKGKTAAEMMVFARYVMFSEVYWHHAVRSATAMLQRAFFELAGEGLVLDSLFQLAEAPMIETLRSEAGVGPAGEMLAGLFGEYRRLYKRVAQLSLFQQPQLFERLAQRPYAELVDFSRRISESLGKQLGQSVAPHEVLVDAPPVKLEVEFQIDVHFPKEACYRPLGDISPVVRTLAREQFDHYVKRVRVFVHPRLAGEVRSLANFSQLLRDATV